MPEGPDEELMLLAKAFDRAWKRYYRPSRIGAISATRGKLAPKSIGEEHAAYRHEPDVGSQSADPH